MRFLKRFNEDLEQEVQSQGKKYTACIEAAKECIEAINQSIDDFKDADDLDSVVKLTECILICELYIYSCEQETENFSKISDLTKEIVKKISELKTESEFPETAFLKLLSEIEKCKDSKQESDI
jgi:hypothetical protein